MATIEVQYLSQLSRSKEGMRPYIVGTMVPNATLGRDEFEPDRDVGPFRVEELAKNTDTHLHCVLYAGRVSR